MYFGFLEINIYAVLSLITAFTVLNLSLIIFLGNRKEVYARAFAFGSFLTFIWVIFVGSRLASIDNGHPNAVFFLSHLTSITHYLGLLIAFTFFYFCNTFPHQDRAKAQKVFWILILLSIVSIPLFFMTELIASANPNDMLFYVTGPLYVPYSIVFTSFFVGGFINLYTKLKTETNSEIRKHLKFMIWSLIIGFIPPTFLAIILPAMGIMTNFTFFLGVFSTNLWVFIVFYTIVRYNQMSVRIVSAEILIITLIFSLFAALLV